jgi:hypothetical protein
MKKSTTTKAWLTGLGLMLGALVLLGTGLGLMLSNAGTWVPAPRGGYDFQPTVNAFFWGTVAMVSAGGLTFLAGVILQFIAWIGAMVSTARSQDKAWFVLLLVLGLIGLQFIIMIAYLVAGPDLPPAPPARVPMPPPLAPPQPPTLRAA